MNKEVSAIIQRLNHVLKGDPWFNRSIYQMLEEIPSGLASGKPGQHPHSAVEIIYHMITWTDFAWQRVEKQPVMDPAALEALDWREIDPQIHGWQEGLAWFRESNEHLLLSMGGITDEQLTDQVESRDYDLRTLLNGIIDHHIYHVAQIAYAVKAAGSGPSGERTVPDRS